MTDPGKDFRESGLLRKAPELAREILLKRLPALVGPALQLGVNPFWNVSNQDVWHAYIMLACTLRARRGL